MHYQAGVQRQRVLPEKLDTRQAVSATEEMLIADTLCH